MRKKQSKMVKANAGITLIALIITVIVMLILAGVAINMVIGDNGIFKKTDEGAKIYKNAANNEATSLNSIDKEMADLMEKLENPEDPMRVVDVVEDVYVQSPSLSTRTEYLLRMWVLTADGKIRVGESHEPGNVFDKLEIGSEVQVEGLPNGNIAHIATNENTAIVLDKAGKVYTFGENNVGQLGNGTTEDSDVAICISNTGELQGKVIKEISISNETVMALDSEGKLCGWGNNTTTPICISNEITGLQDKTITEILLQYGTNFIVKDKTGKIYMSDGSNIVALDTVINEANIEILKDKDIIDFKENIFLDRDGRVYYDENPLVCMNDTFPILQGKKIVKIEQLIDIVILQDDAGKVYTFGYNNRGQLGNGTTGPESDITCINDVTGSEMYNKKIDRVITGRGMNYSYYACIVGNDVYILRWDHRDE